MIKNPAGLHLEMGRSQHVKIFPVSEQIEVRFRSVSKENQKYDHSLTLIHCRRYPYFIECKKLSTYVIYLSRKSRAVKFSELVPIPEHSLDILQSSRRKVILPSKAD